MGETRVDLLHLLEDLRDAYPGSLEETILTEIVANSLDSGAGRIWFLARPAENTLIAADDGSGMARRDLGRYHDIAASTKVRGEGIGFAGVGIKLGLLASEDVTTETRRGKSHVASLWRLASKHKAPWRWTEPPGNVSEHGTAVRLRLHNALSPLLDSGFIESVIQRHFHPLLEPEFEPILRDHYRRRIVFEVDGRTVAPAAWPGTERATLEVRLPRRRKASALGLLVRDAFPLPEDRQGLAVSTLGKVIKRGWDWLGLSPASPERVGGVIEVPALAACLTLNKGDFIRTGPRGATYLVYRKTIQEAVSRQLAAWGDAREPAEAARRKMVRPLERDLERVLVDLADDYPLLVALVERGAGGQRRLPMGRPGDPGVVPGASVAVAEARTPADAAVSVAEPPVAPAPRPEQAERAESEAARLPADAGPRRPAHYGLRISFESRPGDAELGRLVESTVWVNDAHSAYRRAQASRSEGYHLALTVAMALAPLAVERMEEHGFVTAFLGRWGDALRPIEKAKARRS